MSSVDNTEESSTDFFNLFMSLQIYLPELQVVETKKVQSTVNASLGFNCRISVNTLKKSVNNDWSCEQKKLIWVKLLSDRTSDPDK